MSPREAANSRRAPKQGSPPSALSRDSFRSAAEWISAYHPTSRPNASASRYGGTLFGLGAGDQSYLLTIDREFIWTVIADGDLEYIVAGKKRGPRVRGYLVTDNPVLLRELGFRWAVNYESVDWPSWEREHQGESARATIAASESEHAKPIESAPQKTVTATPLHKVFQRAVSAVFEKREPATTLDLKKTGFEETQLAEVSMPSAAPPAPAAPAAPMTEAKPPTPTRAKKRATTREAPPVLPFPDLPPDATAVPPPDSPKSTPAFTKPPRPKPRPRQVLPLPPEVPPPGTSAPDPLPAPPPPRPKSLVGAFSERPLREPVVPPSVPPPVTPSPDPLPTPAPPPSPRRCRTRVLPVGPVAAQLDHDIFGVWPSAVSCPRCGGGFTQEDRHGLAVCEACDGRGWNPPANSPLELEVPVE